VVTIALAAGVVVLAARPSIMDGRARLGRPQSRSGKPAT
jgi:hypothetical protein